MSGVSFSLDTAQIQHKKKRGVEIANHSLVLENKISVLKMLKMIIESKAPYSNSEVEGIFLRIA